MKYFVIILLLVAIVTGASYFANKATVQNTNNTTNTQNNTSKPAVINTPNNNAASQRPAWVGHYSGIKPCENCSNIEVSLMIEEKGLYTIIEKNTNNPSVSVESSGKFSWAATGDAITLLNTESKPQFLIGENHVTLVGNKEYLLTKMSK